MRYAARPVEAAPAPLLPDLGLHGRYQVSASYYLDRVVVRTDDLDAARAALADFAERFASDTEAYGAIYDFGLLRQVTCFWGGAPTRDELVAQANLDFDAQKSRFEPLKESGRAHYVAAAVELERACRRAPAKFSADRGRIS